MSPSYIYFKELDIDSEHTFNLNFSKENEIDAVLFDKDYEYAITGLNLNVKIPEDRLIKLEYEEKLKKSKKIQKIAEDYEDPDLALYILNSETETVKIPFTKKNAKDLPQLKYKYVDFETKKSKELSLYDFVGHFEKFGFEWEHTASGFEYTIKKVRQKIQKQIFLREPTRKKITVDETRIFNFRDNFVYGDRLVQLQKRISLLEGYIWNPRNFNKSQDIYNFTTMSKRKIFFINMFMLLTALEV